MSMKNKVLVRIGGTEYTLVGVESEEHIQRVAYYIDKKMCEIMRINPRLSTAMASVLTAVNVADDYIKTKTERIQFEQDKLKLVEELDSLRQVNEDISDELESLTEENTKLKIELARREAELNEVRNGSAKSIVRPVRRDIG